MSDNVIIVNDLPREIIAINHETIDAAIALCERAHEIIIPSPAVDEQGCRSALVLANPLYDQINDLAKQLEAERLARGREVTAIKTRIDEAVKAATIPLEDQRARLGQKIFAKDRELKAIIAEKQRRAEEEARRREVERAAAEEARRMAAAEAEAAVAAATAAGVDLPPDELPQPPPPPVLDAEPAPYIAPAPRSSVKGKPEYSLAVDDWALVPREFGGVALWKFDDAAALKLLKADAKIPGLRLVVTEGVGAKGRSNAFAI